MQGEDPKTRSVRDKILSEFYTDEIIQVLQERYPHADEKIVREVWKGFLLVVADIASVHDPSTPREGIEMGLKRLFDPLGIKLESNIEDKSDE